MIEHDALLLAPELELVADFDLTLLHARLAPHVSTVRNSIDGPTHTLWGERLSRRIWPEGPRRGFDQIS